MRVTQAIVASTITVSAWNAVGADRLPPPRRRADRVAAAVLLAIAALLVVGLHLPSYLDAIGDHPTRVEYLSSPTPFWLVKLMDLGIVVPAATAVATGVLRRRS